MIRSKRTRVLSAKVIAAFGPHAQREWKMMHAIRWRFYATVDRLWVLYCDSDPVCVIGLRRYSLLGAGAEVYFLLCKGFNVCARRVILFLRRAMVRVVKCCGALTVRVEKDFWIGERFVKHFGFRKVGEASWEGNDYSVFELRA